MIVVDTNITAYLYFDTSRTELAHAVYRKDRDWIAPVLWRHEFLNILVMNTREKGLSLNQALFIWEEALAKFAGSEIYADAEETLKVALSNKITAYDAQFIVLARQKAVPCVTEDKELLSKCPDTAITMEKFLALDGHRVREAKDQYRTRRRGKA